MSWRIPYFQLELGPEEERAALEVIRSNWLTTGPRIAEFEAAFTAALGGSEQVIAVCNCTAALHLALAALDIRPGDEVIVPSLTFVATVNAVRYVGATPVFADICSEAEWNIDPDDVAAKISPRTRALVVMHYGGYPCRMDSFLALASRHRLKIIEDAAHGPLAEWRGRRLGTIGDVGCFSFFSNKNMTTGEGGMVVARDAQVAERIRIMRSHGMTSTTYERFRGHAYGYDVTMIGYNYRMDEIRAAIGLEQLKKVRELNGRRRDVVARYRQTVARSVPAVQTPFPDWNGDYGYHIFPVLLPPQTDRHAVMAALADRGIQTSIHYRPVHQFTAYARCNARVPRVDAIAPRILSLPLYPSLSIADTEFIAMSLQECLT